MAKIRLILAVKSCYDSFILYPYNCTCAGIFIAKGCNLTKGNTVPWVFFTFFKLRRWYQISQSISNVLINRRGTKRLEVIRNAGSEVVVQFGVYMFIENTWTMCVIDVFLVSSLLTSSRFHSMSWCFYFWL